MRRSFGIRGFVFVGFIVLFLAVFFKDSLFSYAEPRESNDFIRVGLTKEFKAKQSLTLSNKALTFGFSAKNVFYPLEVLRSESGLKIKKKIGEFRWLTGEFSSLRLAEEEANRLGEKDLIPVFVGLNGEKGRWGLYYTGGDGAYDGVSKSVIMNDDLVEVKGGDFTFLVNARKAKGYPQFAAGNHLGESLLFLEGKRFRGRMEIGSYRLGGVTAVNVVRLEDYVRGVVPMEMGYTWHLSAMKAQAVAARSFAVATAGFGSDSDYKKGYKLNNSTHQSYGGFDVEGEKPSRACKETRGEFLVYRNKIVRAFFYSTSGGRTEEPSYVWGGRRAYLQSVSDIYESKPEKKAWTLSFRKEEVQRLLAPLALKKGINLGEVQEIKMRKFSPSERLVKLSVIGSLGEMSLENNEIRTAFDLPSTKVRIFSSGEAMDEVSLISNNKYRNYRRKRKLKGATVLTKNGREALRLRSENGGQIMVLADKNRKGFYLGENGDADYLFVGTGFGHGVGMSQSGANGMAEAGFGYKRILMHYYKGAEVR